IWSRAFEVIMKASVFILLIISVTFLNANAYELKSCDKSEIKLQDILTPVAQNTKSWANGKVNVFAVDKLEPAACSQGLAVTLPNETDKTFGSFKCVYVGCFAGVNVSMASAGYDPKLGLLVQIPASLP